MTYQEKGLEYIAFRAGLDALEAAENPQWQQAVNPNTGELAYNADGSPMLFPVTLAQRVARGVKKRLARWLRLRLAIRFFIGVPFLVLGLIKVYGPDSWGDWLYNVALPVFFTCLIWGGAFVGTVGLLYVIGKQIKFVFTGRL